MVDVDFLAHLLAPAAAARCDARNGAGDDGNEGSGGRNDVRRDDGDHDEEDDTIRE